MQQESGVSVSGINGQVHSEGEADLYNLRVLNWKPESYTKALSQIDPNDKRIRIAITEHALPPNPSAAGVMWIVVQTHPARAPDAAVVVSF